MAIYSDPISTSFGTRLSTTFVIFPKVWKLTDQVDHFYISTIINVDVTLSLASFSFSRRFNILVGVLLKDYSF